MKKLIEKYGWKTVTGCALLAIGQLMVGFPELAECAPYVNALGYALGGFGLRVAIAKTPEAKANA